MMILTLCCGPIIDFDLDVALADGQWLGGFIRLWTQRPRRVLSLSQWLFPLEKERGWSLYRKWRRRAVPWYMSTFSACFAQRRSSESRLLGEKAQ